MKTGNKNKHGFTLLEILIVLGLLTLVMSIVVPRITGSDVKAKRQATKLQIKQLVGSLDRYKLDCNFYPTNDQGGLKALLEKPSSGRACPNYDPDGYNEKKKSLPKDPWGTDFVYDCTDGQNYTIKSLGPDGTEGGEGKNADISSSDE